MSTTFLADIDLNKNELKNVCLHNLNHFPEFAKVGQFFYHTLEKKIYIYTGSEWISDTSDLSNYATKEYVDNIVGDIDTILHNLNSGTIEV